MFWVLKAFPAIRRNLVLVSNMFRLSSRLHFRVRCSRPDTLRKSADRRPLNQFLVALNPCAVLEFMVRLKALSSQRSTMSPLSSLALNYFVDG